MILAIAFLMFYQKDATFTIIIVVLIFGLYIFMKRRKGRPKRAGARNFLGFGSPQESGSDQYLKLLVMQQLIQPSVYHYTEERDEEENEEIEELKFKVLNLLD